MAPVAVGRANVKFVYDDNLAAEFVGPEGNQQRVTGNDSVHLQDESATASWLVAQKGQCFACVAFRHRPGSGIFFVEFARHGDNIVIFRESGGFPHG